MNHLSFNNDYVFKDFDTYAKFIQQGDLEHSQLSSGGFSGSLNQLMRGPIMISHHQMNQKILQRGSGIHGYTTFLIPGNMSQNFIWRKSRLKGNVIGILHGGMEHDCITPENFVGNPISIENNYLNNLVDKLGCPEIIDHLKSNESISINKIKAERLHGMFSTCLRANPEYLEGQLNQLILLLIRSLCESIGTNKSIERRGINRVKIFSAARDYVHNHTENTILLADLCHSIGVSERNLRYAFKTSAGLSPKKYINHYRLNKVRSDLKSGSFEQVIEVAHRYGYWHTGQFAADYLKLFGELPSKTLKKV
jgi:AraC family ethanolamine operon transcriptional activator